MQLRSHRGFTLSFLAMSILLCANLTLAGVGTIGGKQYEFVRPPAAPDDAENAVLDIFETKCAFAGCHTGANAPQGLDLTEEAFKANLVKVKSANAPQFLRVKPGDAANSYLIKKVKGMGIKGDRMPRG